MSALQMTSSPLVQKGLLIRRPPSEVFAAFADPAVTTKFWFTKSTGKLAPGATVRWDWEMYGVGADVTVKEFEENSLIVLTGFGGEGETTEFRFVPWEGHTYVRVTVAGFSGTGDDQIARALDSMGGFSLILAAAKALLEHDVVLTVVLDLAPKGLKL